MLFDGIRNVNRVVEIVVGRVGVVSYSIDVAQDDVVVVAFCKWLIWGN